MYGKRIAKALVVFTVALFCATLIPLSSTSDGFPVPICEAVSCVDASIRPIQLNVYTHYTIDDDAEGELLRSSVSRVSLIGSVEAGGFAALQNALRKYTDEEAKQSLNTREEMLAYAVQDRAERFAVDTTYFPAYEALSSIFVRRAIFFCSFSGTTGWMIIAPIILILTTRLLRTYPLLGRHHILFVKRTYKMKIF